MTAIGGLGDLHHFREFADTLPIMICQMSPAGALVFANAAWYAVTKLPRDPSSFETENWQRLIHPDDSIVVVAAIANAVAQSLAFAFAYRLRGHCDESPNAYRWYHARANPQSDAAHFQGWIISIVDIQETRSREAAERELREQATKRENEFKALAEAVPQIVWTADASGSIEWYNHGWYDYTGQTRDEATGWGWQGVLHPEDFPKIMKQWTEGLEIGEKLEMEFRLRGRDGRFRWFLTLVNPYKDESGKIVRWFGTNTDIHERKQNFERSNRIAQTLQEVFLPERLPQTPSITFDALYVPAESDALVGGDWYDAFTLDDGRIVVSIGDVAGHGLDAAVIAGRLRHTIFTEGFDNPDPAQILKKADRILRAQSSIIATALVAVIDTTTGVMTYATAGHPTPIVATNGKRAFHLADGSAPLGTGFISSGLITETHVFTIEPDSMLVFYTDGITEFTRDIFYGQEQLLQAIDAMNAGEMPQSANDIYQAVVDGRTTPDDIAVLLARFKSSRLSETRRPSSLTKQWRFHSSHSYSARSARHELMTFLRLHSADSDGLFCSENIIGELLANTVEHAPGLVEIEIDWTESAPTLTMRDAGPGFLPKHDPGLPTNDLEEDGRGLFLIRRLSDDVSINAAPGFGAEIVVRLPVKRDSAANAASAKERSRQ